MTMNEAPAIAPAPLAITMGDPVGIGPEIIVKLAMDPARPRAPFSVSYTHLTLPTTPYV